MMNDSFLTVSQLNQYIKDVLNAGFPQSLWVCGEIKRYKEKGGHVYFDLVEKKSNSEQVAATISVTIWSTKAQAIKRMLKSSENAFELKDDIEIKVKCRINFWEVAGRLSLNVDEIDPTYTLGRLAQERQKLIVKLTEEGIFEKNKQLYLPDVPLKVGLITSLDSAAYNDIMSEFKTRDFGFTIYLRNTTMQGKNAPLDVCAAIKELHVISGLDVIVISRGGGSSTDLSCFDNEQIARAIAQSKLPVLSGIGHEIDFTITDMAAHTYRKTPTAITQFLVERVGLFVDKLDDYWTDISQYAVEKVRAQMDYLEELSKTLLDKTDQKINKENQSLRDVALRMQSRTTAFFTKHHERLLECRQSLKYRPMDSLKKRLSQLEIVQKDCSHVALRKIDFQKTKITGFQKMVDIAHPANTMKRGFSIARDSQGKIIRSIKDINTLDSMITETSDGSVESQVTGINKGGK